MTRLPLIDREQLPEADQPVFDRVMASRGRVGNIWRVLLNSPNLTDRVLALADELRHATSIERRHRELAVLMVGVVTKCDYEVEHHVGAALKAGITADQIAALSDFETSPLFDEKDRAVIRFSHESTANGAVRDATWAALRSFFDERQAMEIVMTVAWYNTVVRILLPLDVEFEPGFKRLKG